MSESWALPSSLPTDILIITGFKSYCCKGTAATFVPPAFLEATWNTDCTGNCGVNQIKLALERGECRTGELAYCAKGKCSTSKILSLGEWSRALSPASLKLLQIRQGLRGEELPGGQQASHRQVGTPSHHTVHCNLYQGARRLPTMVQRPIQQAGGLPSQRSMIASAGHILCLTFFGL
jgi:hypothetical protein